MARSHSAAACTSRCAASTCPRRPVSSAAGSRAEPAAIAWLAGVPGAAAAVGALAVVADASVGGYYYCYYCCCDEDAAVAASADSFAGSAAVAGPWSHGDSTFVALDSPAGRRLRPLHRLLHRHSQTPDVLPHPCRMVVL